MLDHRRLDLLFLYLAPLVVPFLDVFDILDIFEFHRIGVSIRVEKDWLFLLEKFFVFHTGLLCKSGK
ncbi:hypothetical protein GMSM_25690 [Geomonas sp. Red276]